MYYKYLLHIHIAVSDDGRHVTVIQPSTELGEQSGTRRSDRTRKVIHFNYV